MPLVTMLPLPAPMAYSRAHLRVQYPFDAQAGAEIGHGMGRASGPLINAARQWWEPPSSASEADGAGSKRLILVVSPHAGHKEKLARARRAISDSGLQVAAEIPGDDLARLPGLLRQNGSRPPLAVAGGRERTPG